MLRHRRNTRTRYEYAIDNSHGDRVYTLWLLSRTSKTRIYRAIADNLDEIRAATHAQDIVWNGDGTITAGECSGKMTGKTLLESRGYAEAQ